MLLTVPSITTAGVEKIPCLAISAMSLMCSTSAVTPASVTASFTILSVS